MRSHVSNFAEFFVLALASWLLIPSETTHVRFANLRFFFWCIFIRL